MGPGCAWSPNGTTSAFDPWPKHWKRMNGNKFKANKVLAIKLARSVHFMLKNKTVFDPDRLVAALARN